MAMGKAIIHFGSLWFTLGLALNLLEANGIVEEFLGIIFGC